jgi:hypothetical protein
MEARVIPIKRAKVLVPRKRRVKRTMVRVIDRGEERPGDDVPLQPEYQPVDGDEATLSGPSSLGSAPAAVDMVADPTPSPAPPKQAMMRALASAPVAPVQPAPVPWLYLLAIGALASLLTWWWLRKRVK